MQYNQYVVLIINLLMRWQALYCEWFYRFSIFCSNIYIYTQCRRITISMHFGSHFHSLRLNSPLLLLGFVIAEHLHCILFYSNNLNTDYYRTYTCVAKHYKIIKFHMTEVLISKRHMGPLNDTGLRSTARPPIIPGPHGPWRGLSMSHRHSTEIFMPSHPYG